MRAALLEAVGAPLQLREVPDPSPGPDELVLAVRACGICGSDLHVAQAFVPPGGVLGHEFCGEVAAIGSGVTANFREGQLVVGFPVYGCGQCPACLSGNAPKCGQSGLVGIDRAGAFAEFVTIRAEQADLLPEELSAAHGALVEPLAVALHALDATPRRPGEPVLVLGAGPVGAAVTLWALQLGAGQVVVTDPVPHRRALVERLGATTLDPTTDDVATAFADLTGAPPSTVIECVGVPGLIQHASDVAGRDGWVTVVGVCMQRDQWVPVVPLLKELTIRFVVYYRRQDFATTISMLASGRLDPTPLLTARIGLDELPERFESLKSPTVDCKVLVEP